MSETTVKIIAVTAVTSTIALNLWTWGPWGLLCIPICLIAGYMGRLSVRRKMARHDK